MMDIQSSFGKKMYKDTSVLVAGGSGTIGYALVKLLLKKKAKVTVVSIRPIDECITLFGSDSKNIKFIQADLTEFTNCLNVTKGNEIVINLVGIKGNIKIGQSKVASYITPMLRFQTNLIEASFLNNVKRFLFTSSINVYPQGKLHKEDSVWDGMPKQNDRIPGIAKRVGELLGEAYQLEHGWDAVRVIRPANVYGPNDDFDIHTGQVIPTLIHKFMKHDVIEVLGNGSAVRDFIYSSDVAYWALEALEKAPPNLPINIGSGVGTTIKTLVDTIKQVSKREVDVVWKNSENTGDPIRLLDIERAKNILNFRPLTSLSEGLEKTIDWFVANQISRVVNDRF